MNRVVLFGATGYQGRLTARALVARGAPLLLAGRNEGRVAELARSLGGVEHAVADARDPRSLARLLRKRDVLLTTVGPFWTHGLPQVEAALSAGAHYVDSSGEPAYYRQLFEKYGRRASDCALLTGCAYDFFPGNAAADLALTRAGGAAVRVDIGYFGETAKGYKFSAGSEASGTVTLLEPGLFYRGGRLEAAPIFTEVGEVPFRGGRRRGLSMAGTEHLFLPELHPQLENIHGYWGWAGPRTRVIREVARVLASASRWQPAKRALSALFSQAGKSDGSGPDDNMRARSSSYVCATAYDAKGRALSHVELGDADGFSFTAAILAWTAQALLAGELLRGGFTGPVQAFGRKRLLAGHAEAGFDVLHCEPEVTAPAQNPRTATELEKVEP